jgi:tetratricopeptide (TPR) repeat protein/predicted Ser/Thr protein kinase
MAVVYEAVESASGRRVALKLLTSPDEDGADVKRLQREASLAAKLDHPNIVRIHNVGVLDNTHFICMDFIEGTTLDRAKPELRRAVEILETVARTVHYAHEHGVFHRDLKPENVLLDATGRPVLVDFGLAKNSLESTRITQTDHVVGTPAYMSPEQVRGRPIDGRSDVYGLGVMLFEAATGSIPFVSPNIVELQRQIVEDDPVYPPAIDRSLRTIIERCLQKDRDARYRTAMDLADDLRRWLDGQPITAKPVRIWARHRSAVLYAFAILFAAGAIAAYLVWDRMDREEARLAWIAEGDARRQQKQWTEALAAYEHALTLNPSDDRVRGLRDEAGRIAEEERRRLEEQAKRATALKRASEFFGKAEADLRMLRVRSYREDWRLTEAEFTEYEALIRECGKQMAETGDSGDGWWIVGTARHVMGDWPSARRAFDAGLKANDGHARCLLGKARLMIEIAMLEQFSLNIGNLSGRVETRFKEVLALLEKGIQAGTLKEIELDLARGYALAAANKNSVEFCNEMLDKWKGHDFREEFYLIRGIAHSKGLIQDATAALSIRPGFVEALFWRGIGRQQIKDYRGALRDYHRALEIHPKFLLAYIGRATLHDAQDDYDNAIRDADQILKLHPNHPHGLMIRASMYSHRGEQDAAIRDYTTLMEVEPEVAAVPYNRGLAWILKGDHPAALRDFNRAIELDPQFARAYVERGRMLSLLNDQAAAEKDVYEAYRLDPKLFEACFGLSIVLYHKGQMAEALEKLNEALAIKPNHSEALANRGSIRNSLGDLSGALEDYTRALEADPKNWKANYNRAIVRQKKGDWAGAIEDYTRAIELQPGMASAYGNRGQIYFYLAEKKPEYLEKAISDLSKTLELCGPEYTGRAAVERMLKRAREKSREH